MRRAVILLCADWSQSQLIEVWFTDMVEACEKAGVPIPDLNSETYTVGSPFAVNCLHHSNCPLAVSASLVMCEGATLL